MKGRQPPSPGSHTDKWVAIALFPDDMTAHLALAKLEEACIKSILGNE